MGARIAVVGTGIAGNVVAHKLHPGNDITVYEANNYIGGHSNTVDVPTANGSIPVDTGFIVFNDRTYPNFISLLDQLNVSSQDSVMSFSVQTEASTVEYNGSSLNSLFAQRRNLFRPSFHRMVRDILRFNREASIRIPDGDFEADLADYLQSGQYSREFINHYLVPMGAAIWSAEPEMMFKMPAKFFIRFFENHGLLSIKNRPTWRVIQGGSREYVKSLVRDHEHTIRLGCAVERVHRSDEKVVVYAQGCEPEEFDYLFLACHSDQALAMLANPADEEREVLGSIPYQHNEAILHTDESLMPRRKLAWGAWNYHIPNDKNELVALTYHLNTLQGLQVPDNYFVTLNSRNLIRPDSVIKSIAYEHPVFTAPSVAAQARHAEINGLKRTYFCGAYWRYGFHEDGVVSALNALQHFDARYENAQQHFQRAS
ncbi:MAG: NAD(P)/FAD-dependent oxidoreductase [Woeseiaceae bacterium]